MVHVVCANMPRAGHHLLERMLGQALGQDYRYCEYIQALECCRQIPCNRHAGFATVPGRIFMQKNHDFRMDSPRDLGDNIRFLVQYRHPLPRLFSFFEMRVRAGAFQNTAEDLEFFMAKEAAYQVLFFQKWISNPRRNDILIRYEDLVTDTLSVLSATLAGLDIETESAKVSAAVDQCMSFKDLRGTRHRERDVSEHALYDPVRLESYERFIFSRTGEGYYEPKISRDSHDPVYYGIFTDLAESHVLDVRQDWKAARERVSRIPESHKSDVVKRFMGRLEQQEELIQLEEQVLEQIHEIRGDTGKSEKVRSNELYELGKQLLQGRYPVLAATALSEACVLCPEDGDLHHRAAGICVGLGRYAQAISHCKAAVRACPENAEFYYHGATVMEHHGQIPDALDFSLRAVELQPDNDQYRELLVRIDEQAKTTIDDERYRALRQRVESIPGRST